MIESPEHRDPGEVPVLDWLDVDQIDVDPTYQRELDEARVNRIVDWFEWRSFGAIVVAKGVDGRFNCLDGQHRLEAARRHPKVTTVPAVVIEVEGTTAEAGTFVAINRDRKNITPLDRYWAEVAAGDPEAMTVSQVCERAGVVIRRYAARQGRCAQRETVAVSAIRSLIDRRGAMRARQMLEVLANAGLAPIGAHHVAAVEVLMTDPEYSEDVEAEALTEALRTWPAVLDAEAARFAETHRVPRYRGLVAVWFKKTRKKRRAA